MNGIKGEISDLIRTDFDWSYWSDLKSYLDRQFLEDEDSRKVLWSDDKNIYIQRGLMSRLRGIELKDQTIKVAADIRFKRELRKYQENIIPRIASGGQGIVLMPTASGKTIIMLALAAYLKQKTLIITHTNTIAEGTIQKVKDFCGINAGKIGDQQYDFSAPITVGLIQTIEKRIDELRDQFGMIILDESHHCPASMFFSTIAKFKSKYRYGFTAELKRKDKKEKLGLAVLGDVLVELEPTGLIHAGYLSVPIIKMVKTDFYIDKIQFCQNRCSKIDDCNLKIDDCRYLRNGFWTYMLGKLTKDASRNATIIKTIEENFGLYNLVLSDRKKHLAVLQSQLWDNTFLITGDLKPKERYKILREFEKNGGIVFATSNLLGEGFDLPQIDRLYLTCPAGGKIIVKQRLGRIMRPKEREALVLDFVDQRSKFLRGLWFARVKQYKQFSCKIEHQKFDDEKLDSFWD